MVGQLIGNYRIVRQLGEGGMGVVYEAVRDDIGSRVAIKVLRQELALHAETAARFFNEARAANLIDHPGIVKVLDYGQLSSGAPYLAMEFLRGESLHQRLLRERQLSEPETIRLGRQIAAALAAAHAKEVIHRDLKPENIIIVPDAEAPGDERAKILDFGIAKLAREHTGSVRTNTNMVMGTPVYMSPEQCKGSKHVDDRADVYALGIILFEMLAGRVPFLAEHPGEFIGMHLFKEPPPLGSLVPGAAPRLQRLVDSMLFKDPQRRPPMKVVALILKELGNFASDAVSVDRLAADVTENETQPLIRPRSAPPPKPSAEIKVGAVKLALPLSSLEPPPSQPPLLGQAVTPILAPAGRPPMMTPLDPPTIEDKRPPVHTPTPLKPPGIPHAGSEVPGTPESSPVAHPLALPRPVLLTPKSPAAGQLLGPDTEATKLMDEAAFERFGAQSNAPPPPSDWHSGAAPPPAPSLGNLSLDSSQIELSRPRDHSLAKTLRKLTVQTRRRLSVIVVRRRIAFLIGTMVLAAAASSALWVSLRARPPRPVASYPDLGLSVPAATSPEEEPPPPVELERALADAQAKAKAGDAAGAYKALRSAVKKYSHPLGWGAVGEYACQAGRLDRANEALSHLTDEAPGCRRARTALLAVCQTHDIVLAADGRLSSK
jgi:serine/threonine protein kinase